MSKELVISASRHETRVAVLEDDQLVEVHFQRANEYSLAGSIHKGRVTRVLPGMQSAFVDLGLERDTFLYVSDFLEETEDIDQLTGHVTGEEKPLRRGRGRGRRGGRTRPPGSREERSRQESPETSEEGAAETAEAGSAGEASLEAADKAEEGEGSRGDRRGRRQRRRRGRGSGRGFPESKYAEPGRESESRESGGAGPAGSEDAITEAVEAAVDAATEAPAGTSASEPGEAAPLILPGESLAKYKRQPSRRAQSRTIAAAPAPVTEEAAGAGEGEEPPAATSTVTAAERKPEPEEEPDSKAAAGEADEEEEDVDAEQDEYNEPVHYPPDNLLPDTPVHPVPAEGVAQDLKEPAPAAPVREQDEVSADEQREAEEAVAEGPARAPLYDDDEDSDIQAMILGQAGLAAEERAEEGEEGKEAVPGQARKGGDQEQKTAGEAAESAAEPTVQAGRESSTEGGEGQEEAEGATKASARVRERGSRYAHRVSRRSRRRGRGGPGAKEDDAKADDSNAGESAGETTVEQAVSTAAGPVTPSEEAVPESASGEVEGSADAATQEPAGEEPSQPASADTEPERREESKDEERKDEERKPAAPAKPRPRARSGASQQGQPSIAELLKQGQEIIVQIAKEPLGQKGARITSHVALPGRFVVYMPTLHHMGVSRKIGSDEERQRLKRVLQEKRPGEVGGFITRTAAEGRTEDEIGADMEFLYNLWQDIRTKADKQPAPALLHHDLNIVQRVLRDQLTDDFKAIWIDSEETYESVLKFVERFQPALVGKVKLYTREVPIFDSFGVTQELEKALRPKVWLKSGGYIVINQTEALVAIDVNTGKFVGKSNRLEDTIVKTNTEAIKEIVRQIRLRDLGGIIVIDFIDMDERKNRQKVMQALEEAMRVDRAPYKILQFNDFGLVAITRKRVKQSLERTLCAPCPHCEGAGYVKSVATVVGEILTEARKMANSVEGKDVMLRVHPDVAKLIKSHKNKYLEELEEVLRRPVLVKSDPLLHHEKFDLA